MVAYRAAGAAMTISRERKVRFTCGLLLHVALACYLTTFEIPKFGNSHRILVDIEFDCRWRMFMKMRRPIDTKPVRPMHRRALIVCPLPSSTVAYYRYALLHAGLSRFHPCPLLFKDKCLCSK